MNPPTQNDISLSELEELMSKPPGSFLLLDVRTDQEFMAGHLPGSVHIPIAELALRHGELTKDLPIVVVCHAGVRSAYALEILEERGYRNIRHLPGGLMRLGYL